MNFGELISTLIGSVGSAIINVLSQLGSVFFTVAEGQVTGLTSLGYVLVIVLAMSAIGLVFKFFRWLIGMVRTALR